MARHILSRYQVHALDLVCYRPDMLISAPIIEVATGCRRWSHRFEPTLGDVFATQAEIAQKLATIVDPTRCQISGAMAIGPTRDYPHSALD